MHGLNLLRGARIRHKGSGNRIELTGVRLVRVYIDIEGEDNEVAIGPGSRLFDCAIMARGNHHRVRIGSDCILSKMNVNMQTEATSLNIGNLTTCGGVNFHISEPGRSISIGSDCMISFDVEIRCGDSHSIIDRQTGARINEARDISVGDHVWLGAHSAVLKGASIGSNSIIGLRSIVTGEVPSNCISIGAPSRVARSNVDWIR